MTEPYQINKLLVAADYNTNFRLADRRGELSEELRGVLGWPEHILGPEEVGFRNPGIEELIITSTKTHYALREKGEFKTEKELADRIVKLFSIVFKTLKINNISRVGARFEASYRSEKAYYRYKDHLERFVDFNKSFFDISKPWKFDSVIWNIRNTYRKGPNEIQLVVAVGEEVGLVTIDLDFYRIELRAVGVRDFVKGAFMSLKDVELVLEGAK